MRGLKVELGQGFLLGRPVPRYRGFRLMAAARRAGIRRLVRDFVGTLRRVLLDRY